MWKWLKLDQDEHDGGGGAGGGAASQAGGSAGAGVADGQRPPAGAGAGAGSSSPAGTDGKTSQKSAWEKDTIVWNGQQKELTREEIINYAQQAFNVTQREQAASMKWKEATTQLARLEKLIADADKKNGGEERGQGQNDGEEDPVKALTAKYTNLEQTMEQRERLREWKDLCVPIKQKFPEIDDGALSDLFLEKLEGGLVENSEAGLMSVAAELAAKATSERTERETKLLEKALANSEDPRVKAHNERVIADYVAGKTKLAGSGGEHGGGGAGGSGGNETRTISEIAASLRKGS